VLTDLGDHLALLEANVARNGLGGRAAARVLDWADRGTWASLEADLVIATDCAYHERLYEPLAAVLAAACANASVVLLGVTRSDTGPAFYAALRARGLEYRLAEKPPDDYSALLAVCAAAGFDGKRDVRGPPWPPA